jgi:hypothetical protein
MKNIKYLIRKEIRVGSKRLMCGRMWLDRIYPYQMTRIIYYNKNFIMDRNCIFIGLNDIPVFISECIRSGNAQEESGRARNDRESQA